MAQEFKPENKPLYVTTINEEKFDHLQNVVFAPFVYAAGFLFAGIVGIVLLFVAGMGIFFL